MAIKVKDAAAAARKFVERGRAAGADYTAGVRGAGQDWLDATIAGADNYASGVQEAIGRGAFARGVRSRGAAGWEEKAATIGARRFPEGITGAQGDFQAGVQPYLEEMARLTLPPRRPKGDPSNFLRVQAVGEALRRRKVGG